MRGLEAPTLSDNTINAALKGAKNKESLEEDDDRAVMTIALMKEIKQASKLKTDTRRTIWCVCVSLFMGSLRGSELLSYDSLNFHPVKTLLGSDI